VKQLEVEKEDAGQAATQSSLDSKKCESKLSKMEAKKKTQDAALQSENDAKDVEMSILKEELDDALLMLTAAEGKEVARGSSSEVQKQVKKAGKPKNLIDRIKRNIFPVAVGSAVSLLLQFVLSMVL
jgi:seryl-tRNA synthetase